MDNITVLVLADPAAPALRRLEGIGSGVNVRIGKTADALGDVVAEGRVLFNWTGSKPDVRRILELAPKLEWIHAMYAGLDRSLFPELVESPVPLTNGSGVFSQSLGEFVILGILYFAKDVRAGCRPKPNIDGMCSTTSKSASKPSESSRTGTLDERWLRARKRSACACWPYAEIRRHARETSMWTVSTPPPTFTRCCPNAITWL